MGWEVRASLQCKCDIADPDFKTGNANTCSHCGTEAVLMDQSNEKEYLSTT